METYTETVHRFRILQREEPHDWTLYASFAKRRDANAEIKILRANSAWFQKFKIVDAGKETTNSSAL